MHNISQEAITKLRPHLLLHARRLLGNEDEAEDAVQDTLLKLLQIQNQPVRNISSLAQVIVRNKCIDFIRRKHHTVDVDEWDIADTTSSDSNEAILDQMLITIDTLPTMQQTILKMRHIDGMEIQDIAAMLGTSEEAIRQTLSRARRKVFQQMKKGGTTI